MSGYSFTDRVRTVLQMAREEAARLSHEYVGTEHLLLALIREGDGAAVAALTSIDIDLEAIRQAVEAVVKPGKEAAAHGHELPYTSRAKKVLELAMMAARDLNDTYVGTEHLLLGLLREEKGIAAQVLVHSGVTLDRVTTALGTVPNPEGEVPRAREVPERMPVVEARHVAEATPSEPWEVPVPLRLIFGVLAVFWIFFLVAGVQALVSGSPELYPNQHWRSVTLNAASLCLALGMVLRRRWTHYILMGMSLVGLVVTTWLSRQG